MLLSEIDTPYVVQMHYLLGYVLDKEIPRMQRGIKSFMHAIYEEFDNQ